MLTLSRSNRALVPLIAGFILLVAAVVSAIWLSFRQEEQAAWVRHTLEVEGRINLVELLVTRAETGYRGFLLTGDGDYLGAYTSAAAELPDEVNALAQATADNSEHRAVMPALRATIDAKMARLETGIGHVRAGNAQIAQALMRDGGGLRLMQRTQALLKQMSETEQGLLERRTSRAATTNWIVRAVLVGSGVVVILLAFVVVGEAQRRIWALQAANRELEAEMAERSRAQSQVRQLQKMESLGKLTGGIAHDFNNMLAIVIGSLDIAKRRLTGTENPKVVTAIANARDGAERAATLTARLLAFSRQQPLEPKVLDANKLVAGMSEMLRRTLGETIGIETVLAGGLWKVHADATQIESALINLAVNARDAMPGGGKLTIETANSELDDRYARAHEDVRAGQYVVISITDTGAGMSDEVIERAFEPFFTTKDIGKGTGLGLSQVFGFVKQSRGHLKIYSEIGRGTTIKIYLPRYTGGERELAPGDVSGELPLGSREEVILVVEDETEVRRMSVDALRELGYTVIHAGDGARAIEQFDVLPRVDLLFTDVVMPGMTGRQLADELRRRDAGLKVIYTTGYTRNAIVHNGVVDADVAFIAKPFSIEALARKVREILDS